MAAPPLLGSRMETTVQRLLLQLDGDRHPSVFDAIVASDAGAEQVLRHGAVRVEDVRALVHGCIFTRGPKDLKSTAIFIGGSNVPGPRFLRGALVGPGFYRISSSACKAPACLMT